LLETESERSSLTGKHLIVSVDNADVVYGIVKNRHKSTRLTRILALIDEALAKLDSTMWIDYV